MSELNRKFELQKKNIKNKFTVFHRFHVNIFAAHSKTLPLKLKLFILRCDTNAVMGHPAACVGFRIYWESYVITDCFQIFFIIFDMKFISIN